MYTSRDRHKGVRGRETFKKRQECFEFLLFPELFQPTYCSFGLIDHNRIHSQYAIYLSHYRILFFEMNDSLYLLSRSVCMCTSQEKTGILLHTTPILAGSILFISPPRPTFGVNLRSPTLPHFHPPIVVAGKSFATSVA